MRNDVQIMAKWCWPLCSNKPQLVHAVLGIGRFFLGTNLIRSKLERTLPGVQAGRKPKFRFEHVSKMFQMCVLWPKWISNYVSETTISSNLRAHWTFSHVECYSQSFANIVRWQSEALDSFQIGSSNSSFRISLIGDLCSSGDALNVDSKFGSQTAQTRTLPLNHLFFMPTNDKTVAKVFETHCVHRVFG